MSVTINTLGSNSRQIVINAETSATNIIDAVNTSLTALGWTLYDTVTSGSRGLLTTKVYSAPNADSTTTKYMIIRYDLQRQYWFTSCCESWNTGTNVATNECWYGGRHIVLPLQYSNCILYVFANARYACFMGVVKGEPGPWQGVFEFERSATEDISAKTVPCFAWTSSLTIGEPYGNWSATAAVAGTSANNGPVACGMAPPRVVDGSTGLAAANTFVVVTGLGSYPTPKSFMASDWSSGGVTQSLSSHCGMLGGYAENLGANVWNPNLSVINNIELGGYNSFYKVGKIYGLKVTPKIGAPLQSTTIPVDANLFYSSGGTPTNHMLLGINGGYKDKMVSGSNRLTAQTYTAPSTLGNPNQSVFVSGRYIYFTTSTGFHKFDTLNQFFIYNILPAAAYVSVKFDGENSLYVSAGTTTVYKVSLTDDSYTTYTSSVAISGLAIDDTNLYAASNVAGTTAVVKKVTLSTFTESASWTLTIATGSQSITHISTGDYAGYVYVASLVSATRNANRIVRVLATDGTTTSLTPGGTIASGSSAAAGGQPIYFDGTWLWLITGSATAGTGSVLAEKITLSTFAIATEIQLSASATNNNFYNVANTLGSTEPPSFGGFLSMNIGATSSVMRVSFSDPRFSSGLTVIPADTIVLDSTNTSMNGQYATDGCSLYYFNSTTVIRYTTAYRNYNFNGVQTSNLLIPQ